MSRRAIYITVFSVIFLYNFLGYHLGPGEGYLNAMMPAAMWGAFFCLLPFAFYRWRDQKKSPDPQPPNHDGANQPPPTQKRNPAIPEGYAMHFGQFLTQNDQTKNAQSNAPHYANLKQTDNALGGKFSSFDDLVQIKFHILECCLQVMVDQSQQSEEEKQTIIDSMVTPLCPAGYLYVGGGFYWNGQGHMLTVGSARSGKGTSLIIPTLLNPLLYIDAPNTPSFVVLDPKGENLAITGQSLKNAGYNLVVINPFNISPISQFGSHSFNVFTLFSADNPDFDSYSDMIAYALIPESHHHNSYWDNAARGIVRLYIRHMMTQEEDPKNFTTLWRWLRMAGDDRALLFAKMEISDAFDGDISREVKALAQQVKGGGSEQVESAFSNIRTYTDVFENQQMRRAITETDFDISKIGEQKTAVFVCMAPDRLERCKPLMRIIFGSFMRSMAQNPSKTRKIIMIMDEFVQMGALKEFEIFSNYAAGIGAGITLWPIIQSLDDLQSTYPQTWQKFLNNTIIRHYIKVGDNFTAEYLHKRLPIIETKTYIGERPQMPVELYRIEKESKENPLTYALVGKGTVEWEKIKLQKRWQNELDAYERSARIDKREMLSINEILNLTPMLVEITGCSKPALFDKAPYFDWQHLGSRAASPNPFR